MSLLERLRARLPGATPRGDEVWPSDFVELQQLPIRYGHALDMIGHARNRGDDLLLAEGEAILGDTFTGGLRLRGLEWRCRKCARGGAVGRSSLRTP